MRSRGTQNVEAKTEAILDAAEAHFALRGFEATKIADIARDAGVAVGTIYLRYPGKEELLAGILDRVATRFRTAMDDPAITALPFPERFSAIIHAILSTAAQEEHLARLMSLATFAPAGDAQRLGRILSSIEAHLGDGMARGELRGGLDIPLTASIAYGMVEGAMQHMAKSPQTAPETVVKHLAQAWTDWLSHRPSHGSPQGRSEDAEPSITAKRSS